MPDEVRTSVTQGAPPGAGGKQIEPPRSPLPDRPRSTHYEQKRGGENE